MNTIAVRRLLAAAVLSSLALPALSAAKEGEAEGASPPPKLSTSELCALATPAALNKALGFEGERRLTKAEPETFDCKYSGEGQTTLKLRNGKARSVENTRILYEGLNNIVISGSDWAAWSKYRLKPEDTYSYRAGMLMAGKQPINFEISTDQPVTEDQVRALVKSLNP